MRVVHSGIDVTPGSKDTLEKRLGMYFDADVTPYSHALAYHVPSTKNARDSIHQQETLTPRTKVSKSAASRGVCSRGRGDYQEKMWLVKVQKTIKIQHHTKKRPFSSGLVDRVSVIMPVHTHGYSRPAHNSR